MSLPFTSSQFVGVFRDYNHAIWPMQIGLEAAAIGAVLILWRNPRWADRAIAAILAALWLWMGAAYHLAFFAGINPAAYAFAALSFAGAGLFAWTGVWSRSLQFETASGARTFAGVALLLYALVAYPAIGALAGQPYMESPTFGAPCPTTIFTLGLLMLVKKAHPLLPFLPPILWSMIGTLAAISLNVPQDLGLFAAGAIVTTRIVSDRRRVKT